MVFIDGVIAKKNMHGYTMFTCDDANKLIFALIYCIQNHIKTIRNGLQNEKKTCIASCETCGYDKIQ